MALPVFVGVALPVFLWCAQGKEERQRGEGLGFMIWVLDLGFRV